MTVPRSLDPETQSLVRISASLAAGDEEAIRRAMEAAREAARPTVVEEVLLQSHLFLGFPAALRALALWREVSGLPAAAGEEDDAAIHRERGERLCRIVYGDRYDALRRNIRALHPEMERWMLEEGYGKVLGRQGLELERRELAIVALLAVLGAEVQVQLHSHLRGALRAGADAGAVEVALTLASEYQDEEERRVARATWARVRQGARAGSGDPPTPSGTWDPDGGGAS